VVTDELADGADADSALEVQAYLAQPGKPEFEFGVEVELDACW
jgi:hypothetical protein